MFNIGDKVSHPKYGKGEVFKINAADPEFHYLCRFDDGTRVWLSDGEYKPNRLSLTPAEEPDEESDEG